MGLLFQRTVGGEKHAFNPRAIYQVFARALATAELPTQTATRSISHPTTFDESLSRTRS
jgi:hypothetical protein